MRTAYLPVTGKMYEELAANEVGLNISGCSYANPAGKSSQPQKGKNDFGRIGYNGPCPPPGKAHRYFFKVYPGYCTQLKERWNQIPA